MSWLLWIMLQWTWGCRHVFEIVIKLFSDKYPQVELLDHKVVLFLIFWGPSILFSIVAAPIYIPTNSAEVFPFLHTLRNTYCCLFDNSQEIRQVWGDGPLGFWFTFLWWLVMLSTFSCTCWRLYVFEKMSLPLPILNWTVFVCFCYWVVWALHWNLKSLLRCSASHHTGTSVEIDMLMPQSEIQFSYFCVNFYFALCYNRH